MTSDSFSCSDMQEHYSNPNITAVVYDTTVDLPFQDCCSSSNLLANLHQSELSVPAVKIKQSHMQLLKDTKAETMGRTLLTTASISNVSTSISSSGSNTFTSSIGTFSRPQMASRDRSEAGANHERLTSKPSHDFLPHAYQNHQLPLIPPPADLVQIKQATSYSSSSTFSLLHSSLIDTGAQPRYDCDPVGDSHEKLPTSSQSMLTSRPIRPLPSLSSSTWNQESAASAHGSPPIVVAHQTSRSPSNYSKHSPSRFKSPIRSDSMQRIATDSTHISQNASRGHGLLDGNDSNEEDLYDDNWDHFSQTARNIKGKGRELDTAEPATRKRQAEVDEYPREEMRKGAVGGPRIPSACDACKSSKVRCVFPHKTTKLGVSLDPITAYLSSQYDLPSGQQSLKCERCILHGLDCRVSGRKKRDPPPSQGELERKNEEYSTKLLEYLFRLLPTTAPSTSPPRKTEASSVLTTSPRSQVPSTETFMPQITTSGPRYPGPSNPYPQLNQSSLHVPNYTRTLPSLADLPPLPVLDKTTSRTGRDAKIEKWIAEATERIMKFDYAQPLQAIPAHREVGDESTHSQLEKGSQAQHDREYDDIWNDRTPNMDYGVNIEEMEQIEEDGDHVLDSAHILTATRAYLFGERHSASFEDIPQSRLPPILSKNIITFMDATKLFDIFFDKMNMFFSACDPAIHTPVRVLRSSTFLFTTICAVASKHYIQRPDLYSVLLDYAKDAAGQAIHGPKTVETTQAFLLLGVHMPPSRSFKADRTYLSLGLAIRIAIDIELYRSQYTYEPRPDMPEDQARRLLNRGRTWLNCFCNDRSISTQMGKATAILIRGPPIPFNVKTWWCCSKWNLPSDIHMCAYADLLSVMADFHDVVYLDAYSADGRKKPLNLNLVQEYADKISAVQQTWTDIFLSHFPNRSDIKMAWRDNLWPFLSNYAKLVVLSVGLRNGMLQGLTDKNPFSQQSITAACALLTQVLDKLAKLGYMRYSVEAYFVFMGFAAAFLLKILRRKFSFMRKPGQDEEIISLLERLIALLGSDEVAIDNQHTPKLYSQFLGDKLAQYKRTHVKQKTDTDQADNVPSPQPVFGIEETSVQSHPYEADVSAQSMEDIQMCMYSRNMTQSIEYSDSMLSAPFSFDMGDTSPSMDLDIPLPPSAVNNQDMLLSMQPLQDPMFWEHLGMPLVTNPETWPQVVDMTHGTGAGLYNPLQVHNAFHHNQAHYRTYGSGTSPSFDQYYRQYH